MSFLLVRQVVHHGLCPQQKKIWLHSQVVERKCQEMFSRHFWDYFLLVPPPTWVGLPVPREHAIKSKLVPYEKISSSVYSYRTSLLFHTVRNEPLPKQYKDATMSTNITNCQNLLFGLPVIFVSIRVIRPRPTVKLLRGPIFVNDFLYNVSHYFPCIIVYCIQAPKGCKCAQ